MKKRPNWKLMSAKDKAKYHAKHGKAEYPRGRPRNDGLKTFRTSKKEDRKLLKKAHIPRLKLTQAQRKELKNLEINYWSGHVGLTNEQTRKRPLPL